MVTCNRRCRPHQSLSFAASVCHSQPSPSLPTVVINHSRQPSSSFAAVVVICSRRRRSQHSRRLPCGHGRGRGNRCHATVVAGLIVVWRVADQRDLSKTHTCRPMRDHHATNARPIPSQCETNTRPRVDTCQTHTWRVGQVAAGGWPKHAMHVT